jgi:hypothetical protein
MLPKLVNMTKFKFSCSQHIVLILASHLGSLSSVGRRLHRNSETERSPHLLKSPKREHLPYILQLLRLKQKFFLLDGSTVQ